MNLVANENVEEFVQKLAKSYEDQTELRPEIYVTHASLGAGLLEHVTSPSRPFQKNIVR